MKSFMILICGVSWFQNFAFGRLDLSSDHIVGVSQGKLQKYMRKAAEGFKYIMKEGDEELDYPVMEPYKIDPFSWEYVDTSGGKKYRLNLFNRNSAIIKGLSNYKVVFVDVSASDMKLLLRVQFDGLESEFPYKLDGFLFKNIIPVYGEGLVKLSSGMQYFDIFVDLQTDRGYIKVENVQIQPNDYDVQVQVSGLMDMANSFASGLLDSILDSIVKEHADTALTKFARNLIEETIGGMTTDEFFDLLDHFVKKNLQQ